MALPATVELLVHESALAVDALARPGGMVALALKVTGANLGQVDQIPSALISARLEFLATVAVLVHNATIAPGAAS